MKIRNEGTRNNRVDFVGTSTGAGRNHSPTTPKADAEVNVDSEVIPAEVEAPVDDPNIVLSTPNVSDSKPPVNEDEQATASNDKDEVEKLAQKHAAEFERVVNVAENLEERLEEEIVDVQKEDGMEKATGDIKTDADQGESTVDPQGFAKASPNFEEVEPRAKASEADEAEAIERNEVDDNTEGE